MSIKLEQSTLNNKVRSLSFIQALRVKEQEFYSLSNTKVLDSATSNPINSLYSFKLSNDFMIAGEQVKPKPKQELILKTPVIEQEHLAAIF